MAWIVLKNWFTVHRLNKMDPAYVVSCKYINVAKVFATGTTNGEVKLWDNKYCECLGVVNSSKWDPYDLKAHMGLLEMPKPVIVHVEE